MILKINERYIGAIIIAPIILFLLLGGLPLKIFTIVLSCVGMHEFYSTIRKGNFRPVDLGGYILLIVYYIFDNNFQNIMYFLILSVFILFILTIFTDKINFIDVGMTLLGFVYVGMFFSFIYLVASKSLGEYYVWLIFIGAWITDSAAYYAGRYLGKHKLCPTISPKKTVEGSIGGLIGSVVICGLFGILINNYVASFPVYHFFIIGGLCGVFSQFGDLVASSIKRYVGIKDYSNLIPGHGGILDRFDSILFCGVVVFYYLTFIIQI